MLKRSPLLAFYFQKVQECQAVGLGNKANYPKRDWTWVISFTINSGLRLYLQLIPVSETLMTRCDSQHRSGKRTKKMASIPCVCVFRQLSLTQQMLSGLFSLFLS